MYFLLNHQRYDLELLSSTKLSYEEICAFAGKKPEHNPTVVVCSGNLKLASYTVTRGQSTDDITSGTIINCMVTGNA